MPCSDGPPDGFYENRDNIQFLCKACLHLSCAIMHDIRLDNYAKTTLLSWYCNHVLDDLKEDDTMDRTEQLVNEIGRIKKFKLDLNEDELCTTLKAF